MLLFVLKTFRVDDDEVQKVHLPLIFAAVVEKLGVGAILVIQDSRG